MSKPEFIEVGIDGEVARIVLHRPEKLNALTNALNLELAAALDGIAADPAIKLVVLSGSGRGFSAGYDVSPKPVKPTAAEVREHVRIGVQAKWKIWTLPQPVIAKVHGPCLGGGFDMMLACDLAIASEDAFFGEPEVKFGGGSMFMLLPYYLGPRHVNELLYTGRTYDARRACELGLVNEVVPKAELDQRVDAIARHMCAVPTGTLVRNKSVIRRIEQLKGVEDAIGISGDTTALSLIMRNEDLTEFKRISKERGVKAALEWQKARFVAAGAYP